MSLNLPRVKYLSQVGKPFQPLSAEAFKTGASHDIPVEIPMGTPLGIFICPKAERQSKADLFSNYGLWENPAGICPLIPKFVTVQRSVTNKFTTVWSKEQIYAGYMVIGFGFVKSARVDLDFSVGLYRCDIETQLLPLIPNFLGIGPPSPRLLADDALATAFLTYHQSIIQVMTQMVVQTVLIQSSAPGAPVVPAAYIAAMIPLIQGAAAAGNASVAAAQALQTIARY